MSRSSDQRFADIIDAIDRCRTYRNHLRSADPLIASMASGLRNVVVHEYFRVDRDIVIDIVDNELLPLREKLLAQGE